MSTVLPRITPFEFEDNPLHEGQYVQVQCLASDGDFPITFHWMLNGMNVKNFPDVTISTMGKRSSILVIESLSHSHAGNYTCNAKNSAGDSSYVAELQVNG